MAIDNDQLLKVIAALDEAGGNKQKAADALGMHVNTLKYQIQLATRRNLYSDAFGGVVPPGYELGKITQLHKSEDGKTMEWRHLQPLGIGPDPLEELERRFSQSIT